MEAFSFETLILKPLLEMLVQLLGWVLRLFQSLNNNFLEQDIVKQIIELFQYVMYAMYLVGILLALIDFVSCYLDGSQPHLLNLVKNVGKGLFITLFMQKIMQLAYEFVYYLSTAFFHFEQVTKRLNETNELSQIFHFKDSTALIGVVVVSGLIIIFVMMLFQLLERNGMFLLHQCMGIFYIVGVCRGTDMIFSTWIRQGIALCFMNFMQVLFFVVGLMMLYYPDVMLFAIGILLVSIRMDKMIAPFILADRAHLRRLGLMDNGASAFFHSMN